MPYTNYLKDKVVQHVFMGVTYTPPGNVYLALFTTAPSEAGDDGVEVTGGSYARQNVAFVAGTNPGEVVNSATESISNMPACTVEAAGFFDASTGGNLLSYDDLNTPITYVGGDAVEALPGQITVEQG